MRAPGLRWLLAMWGLCCMARCLAEPARPLEPIKLRHADAVIETASPALYDGRDVFVPLDVARALRCTVTVLDREESAIIGVPDGHRKEVALTRLRRVPMIPLASLAPILSLRFSVQDGECELVPIAPSSVAAKPVKPAKTASSVKPWVQTDPPGAQPGVQQPPPKSSSGTSSDRQSVQRTGAGPSGVQSPETVEGAGQLGTPPTQQSVATPVDPPPATVTAPIKAGVDRGPIRIREVVCEAVDPAQARVVIVADGPLRPTVRMAGAASELTVDLPGTILDSPVTEWTFANPLVASARAATTGAPGVTRIVFALRRLVTFRDRVLPPDSMEVVLRLPKLVGRRFDEMRIVLDPGHGGPAATGCSAMVNGRRIYEKDLNLQIARLAYERLRKAGLDVSLTRTTDVAVSLSDRPMQANNKLADVFVSIHVDDAPGNSRASGPTAYYHGSDVEGRALGLALVEGVARAGDLPSRGSRSDLSRFTTGMAVLRRAEMPAVLIEIAYISNPSDRAKLISPEFQAAVAGAIADGIRRYVEGRLPADAGTPSAETVGAQEPEGL